MQVTGSSGIDWLEFSTPGPVEEVKERLGGEWFKAETGASGYHEMEIADWGAVVLHDARRPEVHVSLRAEALHRRLEGWALELVGWARDRGRGDTFSRIDLQATVPYDVLTVAQFTEALRGDEVVTHARKGLTMQGFSVGRADSPPATARPSEDTCYLGQPKSRRRVRVYDKGAESDGEEDGTRIELQERDEAADACARDLVTLGSVREVLAGRLVDFIDFREATTTRTNTRRRTEWWAAVVGAVKALPAYDVEPAKTAAEVEAALRQQWAPMMAALAERGDLDVKAILEEGRKRWGFRHRRLVAS